jgi:hypothetical protein
VQPRWVEYWGCSNYRSGLTYDNFFREHILWPAPAFASTHL